MKENHQNAQDTNQTNALKIILGVPLILTKKSNNAQSSETAKWSSNNRTNENPYSALLRF